MGANDLLLTTKIKYNAINSFKMSKGKGALLKKKALTSYLFKCS